MHPSGSSDNRAVLIVIAVFCGIMAVGTVVGLGIWAYSWWQAKQLVDDLVSPFSAGDSDSADIATGVWSGDFEYPDGSRVDMSFTVRSSNPVSGSMTFESPSGGSPCVVSVSEQSRTSSTVTVTTAATSGPDTCADAGRWEIVAGSSSLSGELVWSTYDSLIGSELDLDR